MLRHCSLLTAVAVGFFTMGCSEAVPPANQGSVQANFRTSSINAELPCNIGVHDMQVGFTHATQAGQITYLTDGEGGAKVFCSVRAEGGGFNAQGLVEAGANVFEFNVTLSADNNVGNRAEGTVGYRTVQTVTRLDSPKDNLCEFWLNDSQEVAEGRVWAQFECRELANPQRSCGLVESTLAFQNCDF